MRREARGRMGKSLGAGLSPLAKHTQEQHHSEDGPFSCVTWAGRDQHPQLCQCPEQGRSPLCSPPHQSLPLLHVAEREALSVPEKRPILLVQSCPECVLQGNSFPGGSEVKNLPDHAGDAGNAGLIPGWGRFSWRRK